MVLPGHLAGGYLVTSAVLSALQPDLSVTAINSLFIIGTLCGELPDIDLAIHPLALKFFPKSAPESHRSFITHAPLAWLIFSAIIFAFGFIFGQLYIQILGILVFSGTWCHFIFDSIEYGVRWLWPWTDKKYCLSKRIPSEAEITAPPGSMKSHLQFVQTAYMKTWTFWAELIVTFIAILVFIF